MSEAGIKLSASDTNSGALGADYEYVGFWIRVAASLIDSVLLLIVIAPLVTLIYGEDYWLSESPVAGFWDIVVTWALPAVAVIVLWQWRQATPGKMMFRARIVDARSGRPPTTRQWIVRYLGYYVSTVALLLGFLWVAWDRRKQGWHDKLAGTVVIRPKDKGTRPVGSKADRA